MPLAVTQTDVAAEEKIVSVQQDVNVQTVPIQQTILLSWQLGMTTTDLDIGNLAMEEDSVDDIVNLVFGIDTENRNREEIYADCLGDSESEYEL